MHESILNWWSATAARDGVRADDLRRARWKRWRRLKLLVLVATAGVWAGPVALPVRGAPLPGLSYSNHSVPRGPWSIHVVQMDRANPLYELHSIHAEGKAVGLETLSDQVALWTPKRTLPVAALNGDFYHRDRAYAGAPRGLQITGGELLSGPSGGVSFWLDALGEPHITNVASRFEILWPDGTATPFGLNGERRSDGIELYTAAVGSSTHTAGGRELVLARGGNGPWLPLQLGRTYSARVREIREKGDAPLAPDILVLSLGPARARSLPGLQPGAVVRLSTGSVPALRGVRTAISGGPVLVREGRRERLRFADSDAYQFNSMFERHPRSALGWNKTTFFLVEVDGRQRRLSVGMTLDEFSAFLVRLGCEEAMNFDGGGSATLWYDGEVRNSPCDRAEREIANCLVISRKKPESGGVGVANGGGGSSGAVKQGDDKDEPTAH
jgi:hypothetical protein